MKKEDSRLIINSNEISPRVKNCINIIEDTKKSIFYLKKELYLKHNIFLEEIEDFNDIIKNIFKIQKNLTSSITNIEKFNIKNNISLENKLVESDYNNSVPNYHEFVIKDCKESFKKLKKQQNELRNFISMKIKDDYQKNYKIMKTNESEIFHTSSDFYRNHNLKKDIYPKNNSNKKNLAEEIIYLDREIHEITNILKNFMN